MRINLVGERADAYTSVLWYRDMVKHAFGLSTPSQLRGYAAAVERWNAAARTELRRSIGEKIRGLVVWLAEVR